MRPAARYAKAGDLNIAYLTVGDGPVDLVWVSSWIWQSEHLFEDPTIAAAFERLGRFSRLILFDRRGSGLSDPIIGAPTLEEQMDDVLAAMDAAGSEQAAILGNLDGGPLAAVFAASHPERTRALVLYATYARTTRTAGYEWAQSVEERDARIAQLIEHWGEGVMAGSVAPGRADDPRFMEWAGRMERLAHSPGSAARVMELMRDLDVRDVLPTIRVPTLVLHRRGDTSLPIEHSRYLAEHIPGARYVELEGADNMFSSGDVDSLLGEVEEFLTGTRHAREPDRMLATVLFTDIVRSTERAAELGDRSWRSLLERHDELVRRSLERHRGHEVKNTGDGFLASFDGPARAIRCAAAIVDSMRDLGIEVRAGLHTGECEVRNGDLGGLAVHIGARVMGCAGAGEVLVSSTVKDLVVGSGIEFTDRGARELRGVPGEWRLFLVA